MKSYCIMKINPNDRATWPPENTRIKFIVNVQCLGDRFEQVGTFEPPGGDLVGFNLETGKEIVEKGACEWGTFFGQNGFYDWDDVEEWHHLN